MEAPSPPAVDRLGVIGGAKVIAFYVGPTWPMQAFLLAQLGQFGHLCWLSLADIGIYVGPTWPIYAFMLARLGRYGHAC